jgi:UDP-N-acetylmuramoyl-tripeptide--D-alanyl-D-alanine ligase
MKTLTLLVLITASFFIRWSRWLAIVQQKEYRWDRLWLFLLSPEGQQDFWRLIPRRQDLTRTGLKRPQRTARVAVVSITSAMLLGLIGWLMVLLPIQGFATWLAAVGLVLILIYVLLPLLIILATGPSALISFLLTQRELRAARTKIDQLRPLIIGITGSYGKTSTKLLIDQVLSTSYQVFVTPKSFNTRYSVAKAINQHFHGQQIAIIEYGAYTKGEIKFLANWFPPQVAVVTGLTLQHVGLFGDVASIIKAKAELVKATPEGAAVFCHRADQGAAQICDSVAGRQQIAFSGEQSAVALTKVGLNPQGLFKFTWHGQSVQTQLVGRHYQAAVEAAIAVGLHFEVPADLIVKALEAFTPTDNFIQLKTGVNGSLVIDDGGTANAQGFTAALELLAWYKSQGYTTNLIASGIVDLGQWSDEIHQELAQQALPTTDQLVYLGTDGRQVFSQVFNHNLIADRAQLAEFLAQIDQKTVTLIEGRVPTWAYQELGL